jgi:dihydroorotate dehydrogenase
MTFSSYDIERTYDWNYAHAPAVPAIDVPNCAGAWDFCGLPLASPLGVPAGPLLNGRWILYYAALGFDVLTYKTVRSVERASYTLPNLLPVRGEVTAFDPIVTADAGIGDSWAISFGMPSRDPQVWERDVEAARRGLPGGKVLVVSVVASPGDDWTLDRIAADYAYCAGTAIGAGAHAVEANLSCPNVSSREGRLYESATASQAIASAIRQRIGDAPLVLKVGIFERREQAEAFVRAVDGIADAISTTNTIAARVIDAEGKPLFNGSRRGIGGRLIGARCLRELNLLRAIVADAGARLRLVSVGGVASAEDVVDRLAAGAHHVQIATAAMQNPGIAIDIRKRLDTLPTMNTLAAENKVVASGVSSAAPRRCSGRPERSSKGEASAEAVGRTRNRAGGS